MSLEFTITGLSWNFTRATTTAKPSDFVWSSPTVPSRTERFPKVYVYHPPCPCLSSKWTRTRLGPTNPLDLHLLSRSPIDFFRSDRRSGSLGIPYRPFPYSTQSSGVPIFRRTNQWKSETPRRGFWTNKTWVVSRSPRIDLNNEYPGLKFVRDDGVVSNTVFSMNLNNQEMRGFLLLLNLVTGLLATRRVYTNNMT